MESTLQISSIHHGTRLAPPAKPAPPELHVVPTPLHERLPRLPARFGGISEPPAARVGAMCGPVRRRRRRGPTSTSMSSTCCANCMRTAVQTCNAVQHATEHDVQQPSMFNVSRELYAHCTQWPLSAFCPPPWLQSGVFRRAACAASVRSRRARKPALADVPVGGVPEGALVCVDGL